MGVLINQKIFKTFKRMMDLEVQNIIPGNETVEEEIKDGNTWDLIISEVGSLSKNPSNRKTISEGLGREMKF